MNSLEEAIKRYKKHSECIQQTLITKEEAMNVYEWLRELKESRRNRICGVSMGCATCIHIKTDDYTKRPCGICCNNYFSKYEAEVNADDGDSN